VNIKIYPQVDASVNPCRCHIEYGVGGIWNRGSKFYIEYGTGVPNSIIEIGTPL